MSRIKLPQLEAEQVKKIQAMHKKGWSINQISALTKIPYTTVYFFTVNKGQPAAIQEFCWCGAKHYGNGLCRWHWTKERRAA